MKTKTALLILAAVVLASAAPSLADSFSIVHEGKSYTCTADHDARHNRRSCSIPATYLNLPGTNIPFYFNGCSVNCSAGKEASCTPARFDQNSDKSFSNVQAECSCI